MAQSGSDAAVIAAKQREISSLQQSLQERSLAYQFDARNILTSQQISRLPQDAGSGLRRALAMAPGTAEAWAIAQVSEAVMAADAAWVGEPGLAEPGNEVRGRGNPLLRQEV